MPAHAERIIRLISLLGCLATLACGRTPATSIEPPDAPAFAMASGEWSVPVHLDDAVNSPYRELAPTLSADNLSLYFNSDRPADGSVRNPALSYPFDLYVSRRACLACPWEPARNLGAPVNGPEADDNDGAAALSPDGHLLFWSSNREGSVAGSEDIWMARRADPHDDFGWENPVNLGPLVNSAAQETGPSYVVAAAGGHAELYFSREQEIWVAMISRSGEPLGPAVLVSEIGQARSPSVRKDGREMIVWSPPTRPGLGDADVFVSTRSNPTASWTEPVNLGAPVNTAGGELESAISLDGTILLFSGTASRGSSLGRQDIWIATRRRGLPDE